MATKQLEQQWLHDKTPESDPVLFHIVKGLAIGYTTVVFLICGLIIGTIFDRIFTRFHYARYGERSTSRIVGEIMLQTALVGITVYITRRLVSFLPCPFEGMVGFKQSLLSEKGGGVYLTTAITIFISSNLTDKIRYVMRERFRV